MKCCTNISKFWNQFGLNASLELVSPLTFTDKEPNIKIKLTHCHQIGPVTSSSPTVTTAPTNICPPGAVRHIWFEGLRLECNFTDLDWKQKRCEVPSASGLTGIVDDISWPQNSSKWSLVSTAPSTEDVQDATSMEAHATKLPGARKKMRKRRATYGSSSTATSQLMPIAKRRRQDELSPAKYVCATDRQQVIRNWLQANLENSFPSPTQKAELTRDTGDNSRKVLQC